MNGIERIAAERERQLVVEEFDPAHDARWTKGQLAWAAVCYAAPGSVLRGPYVKRYAVTFSDPWPFEDDWDKRSKHGRLRQLEIAGAFIAAEIDRLLEGENDE